MRDKNMFYPLAIYLSPEKKFILEFKEAIIFLDPRNLENIAEFTDKVHKPVNIMLSGKESDLSISDLSEMYRVIAPPIQSFYHPLVSIYREEETVFLTKNLLGYFLNPPTIDRENNTISYFIFLTTTQLEVLYVPRITFVANPPNVDIILTYEHVLDQAKKFSEKPNNIPKYLGGTPQWCIVLSKKDSVEPPIIYINRKKYGVYRHLLEVRIREIRS